jgi:hypothetical protein
MASKSSRLSFRPGSLFAVIGATVHLQLLCMGRRSAVENTFVAATAHRPHVPVLESSGCMTLRYFLTPEPWNRCVAALFMAI